MAEQMHPSSPRNAPDPSNNYERSHPEREAGMGRLDNEKGTPTDRPDKMDEAVENRQRPRQANAREPEGSMLDEEPRGEDLAPQDIHEKRFQRHPRREGKGGTP